MALIKTAVAALAIAGLVATPACIKGSPASDMGDPGFPFGPVSIGFQPIAYVQDIQPTFNRDCAQCHGADEIRGGYSVRTYTNTIQGQRAGDARSSLVVDCSPGGSMYRYFSGDAVTEATAVFRWVVVYNMMQSR